MSTHPSSSCMLCGSPCKQHAFILQPNKNDPDSILDDIERLDKAMRSLCILKSQRCHQLNTIHSSTKTIPNEILLSIFQYFCSLFRSQDFPQFILGGVCHHWRSLLNSTPRFWKSINLQIRDLHWQKAESLLQTFKGRNGASFEFIQLRFERLDDQRNSSFQRLLPSMRGVTVPTITLHDPPVDLLRIINNNLDTHDVSLTRLSYLTTGLKSIPGFSLPWSALTTLRLFSVRIDICCDLLLGCPYLIQFSSHDPFFPTDGWSRIRPKTRHARETCFPNLRHLTWSHASSEWDNNFLSFYRFPALQHLHWRGHDHSYSVELFHDFTSFLPQSCVFQLSAPEEYDVKLVKAILLRIEHPVEQLICSHFYKYTLSVALERLQDPTFIPSLTFFKWEHRDIYYMYEERILELTRLFNDALQGRSEIGLGRFRMEIGGLRLRYGFDKHDREKIYELMDGGWFDFEIADNGDWIMSF